MKNKEYISPLQFYLIVVGYILGTAIILSVGVDIAGKDIWISHLMAMTTSIIILIMIFLIVDKYPDKDAIEILEAIFGKFCSKIILLIFLLGSISLAGLVLSNIGQLMLLMVIPYTEQFIYVLGMSMIASFILSKGMETSSRCIELTIAFSMFIYVGILMIMKVDLDLTPLLPMFSKDLEDIFKTAIMLASFPYTEIFLIFFLVPSIRENKRKKALKSGVFGVITASLLLIITELLVISIFGENESGRILFTTYEAIRMISLGDFFQRIEIVILWIWFFTTYSKFTICLYVTLKSIEGIFNLKDYKRIAIPIGLLFVPIGTNAYKNYEEISVLTRVSWPIVMTFMVALLIIIFLLGMIKKKRSS